MSETISKVHPTPTSAAAAVRASTSVFELPAVALRAMRERGRKLKAKYYYTDAQRHRIRMIFVVTTVLAMIGAVIGFAVHVYQEGVQIHLIAWGVAFFFCFLTVPLSIRTIIGHINNMNQPHVQYWCIRVLLMVPIYSIESWLSLANKRFSVYIITCREAYEVRGSFKQFWQRPSKVAKPISRLLFSLPVDFFRPT